MNPPFGLEDIVGETKSMKGVMNIIQPLGLAYIAAVLEENGFEVTIKDAPCLDMNHHKVAGELSRESPDVVGITATTTTLESAAKTATLIRENLPDTVIVIGGSHVTALPNETLSLDCFDVGVLSEGDITFLELVKQIQKKGLKDLEKIDGIVFKENGKIIQTKPRPFIKNLDEIPFPARHLLPPLSKYHPTPASYKKLPHAHMMTSRGCPWQCRFCDRAIFGRSCRFRSVENVFDEIEELIDVHGMRDLKFFDDTFTLNLKRGEEICDEFKKRKIDIPWCCLTRANRVNKKILQKMKDAGCWQVLYGLESMDEKVLASLKKGTTVKQNIQAVKWAHEVGLSVRGDFIVGTPEDTWESMERTIKTAMKLNMDFAHFNKFTPFPGSELYDMLVEQGYSFDYSKKSSSLDHGMIMYTPPKIDEEEYRKWLDDSYRRYYLRPRYLLKQLSQIRSFQDVDRLLRGFKAIWGMKNA